LHASTARQAEHDVSIPDQRKQGEAYCAARGYQLVETFVDAGASATNDRRPEFQQMIEAGTAKPAPFEVVVVHSFSRFFRDHFELEFYVRKLAKNGIRLVSITQEMGDDPMRVMMHQIMALCDEYQSKENAKHVLRALKESWKAQVTKPSLRRCLQSSRRPRASGCAWQVAATAATISGRWPSALKSTTARFASWDQSPTCCER
jgi:DNA invertase Pin-like site-specific DNA recombinase